MALPSSGAINIGKYNRELLKVIQSISPLLQLSMNSTKFRYVNGATTDSSTISMSSGYGRYGFPRYINLTPAVNNGIYGHGFIIDGNDMYTGGSIGTDYYNNTAYGLIVKINVNAASGSTVVWAKSVASTVPGGGSMTVYDVKMLPSGQLVALANESGSGYTYILKINPADGSIIDQRQFTGGASIGYNLVARKLMIGADSSIYITGEGSSYYSTGLSGVEGMTWKLNSDLSGNYLFYYGGTSNTQTFYSSKINGSTIAHVGYAITVTGGRAYGLVVVTDLDSNIIWSRYLQSPVTGVDSSTANFLYDVAFDSSGNVYVVGDWLSTVYKSYIAKFDTSGNLLWAKYNSVSGRQCGYNGISYNSDGYLYVSGYQTVGAFGSTFVHATAIHDLNGNMIRYRTGEVTTNNGSSYKYVDSNRACPAFDSQGNVVSSFRMDHGTETGITTTSINRSVLFFREKMYSSETVGILGAYDPGYQEIVGTEGTLYTGNAYTRIPGILVKSPQVRQSVPTWDSYYPFTQVNITIGTYISAFDASALFYGYKYTSGLTVTTSYPATYTNVSMAANPSYWVDA